MWGAQLFKTTHYYKFFFREVIAHAAFRWLWKAKSVPKIKVFGWFLLVDRLNTHNMLKRRHYNIGTNLDCLLYGEHIEETVEHLFFTCPVARGIWQATSIRPCFTPISDLFSTRLPTALPTSVRSFMILIILWKIWDTRNKKVFQGIDLHTADSIRAIIDDITIWAPRLKTESLKEHAGLWRDFLSSRNT